MGQRSLNKLSPWFQYVSSGAGPGEACLVCVPPAGGGAAAYWTWTQWLPSQVDLLLVQPPGREDRYAEPPEWTLDQLRDNFSQVRDRLPDLPYFVLGHSMGGLVGTHLATWLAATRDLRRLIVSSYRPDPSESRFSRVFPGGRPVRIDLAQLAPLSGMDVEEWRRLPAEIQEPLTRRWFADLALSAELPVPSGVVLDCPVTAWLGDRDLMAEGELMAWSKLTSSSCEVESWPGGHNYLFARPTPVQERLIDLLAVGECG
ncbi:thioesterase II family protein [Streptomyces tubercidicus]|uniref:Pyochelin biosynthetic protein PchC n=1 Tax=Streptomyces tubercidicus TaxID=47759 RepID=A0A640UM76_9ACTN|nr:alpha/beta fold hydrolase [Streptomyces tubercidicus]WAU10608.1 alpha/beta fold hydrolase [Streptomyces tubercidicus]GFE35731.1 pyochelin biosynthetic protein PchC [Streptomyces tubercidicus]